MAEAVHVPPESAPKLTSEPTVSSYIKSTGGGKDSPEEGSVYTPTTTPTSTDGSMAATESKDDKTTELLAVVDEQESKDSAPEVFAAAAAAEEEEDGDDQYVGDVVQTENEEPSEDEWEGIQAPPEKAENVDEKYDDEAPPMAMEETTKAIEKQKAAQKKQQQQFAAEQPPDFSHYKTNVAQRLWNAQQVAEKAGKNQSGELVRLLKEYQAYRRKTRQLIKAADDYQAAMKNVTATRSKLFDAYAAIAKGTPIWDAVGKPLTPEQQTEIQRRGEKVTPASMELQSKSIMKVAEEIGGGSLVAMQQLAAMHDSLNQLDYKTRIADYIDEWDQVVTSHLDDEVGMVRDRQKKRDHYMHKVDKLRTRINKIEHRGMREAPDSLNEKLDRNEAKLEKADDDFEDMANDMVVVLDESIRRGWVDLFPLLKNAIKFEVNRIGRENASYGRFPLTLDHLKGDYKEATKGTVDYPGYKPPPPEKPAPPAGPIPTPASATSNPSGHMSI